MRTIANLNGVEFLRAVNRTRHAVEKLMKTTSVLEIWKRKPTFTGKETPEEQNEIARSQIKKNLNDLLDSLLETHPEETYECFLALCVLDEGETVDGIAMLEAVFSLISDKRVVDFLLKLGKSGLSDMVA